MEDVTYDKFNENEDNRQKYNLDESVKRRAQNFYKRNKDIKPVKLLDLEGNTIKCQCGAIKFKLYTKFGGQPIRGKYGKVIAEAPVPTTYNFICQCGERLVIRSGTFKYGKLTFGCNAKKCPKGKTKMDKECLTCKYIYEK